MDKCPQCRGGRHEICTKAEWIKPMAILGVAYLREEDQLLCCCDEVLDWRPTQ